MIGEEWADKQTRIILLVLIEYEKDLKKYRPQYEHPEEYV